MGEKNQNVLEFFRKLNHPYLKSILSMKLTGSEVHMENAIFPPFSFLFCFCLSFFFASHKKVVLQIIGVFDHIYYIIRFLLIG